MDNSNSSIEFCNLLFLNRDFNDEEKEKFSFFLKNVSDEKSIIPYDLITQRVLSYDEKNIDCLLEDVSRHLDDLNTSLGDLEKIQIGDGVSYKILSHVNMFVSIKKGIIQSEGRITEYYDSEINKAKSEIHSLKQKVYTDFIATIGIFTSIIFALFGGIQMLSNIFGKNKLVSYHQVGDILLLGGFYLLSMYGLLVALISGISVLTNKKYSIDKKVLGLLFFISVFMGMVGLYLMRK